MQLLRKDEICCNALLTKNLAGQRSRKTVRLCCHLLPLSEPSVRHGYKKRASFFKETLDLAGAGTTIRTQDLRITSALLYQLSYTGMLLMWSVTRTLFLFPLFVSILVYLSAFPT